MAAQNGRVRRGELNQGGQVVGDSDHSTMILPESPSEMGYIAGVAWPFLANCNMNFCRTWSRLVTSCGFGRSVLA